MTCYRLRVLVWRAERDPLVPQHRSETWVVSAADPDEALGVARAAATADGFRLQRVDRIHAVGAMPSTEAADARDDDDAR